MKSIRLKIEQIDESTVQAYRDVNEAFRHILNKTAESKKIFTKVWRTFPDGSAWIVPEGENKGEIITGIAYDPRYDKAYLMKGVVKKDNEATFIPVDELSLHLLASLLRCIENLNFSAKPGTSRTQEKNVPAEPNGKEQSSGKEEKPDTAATNPEETEKEAPAQESEAPEKEQEGADTGDSADDGQEETIEFTGKPIEPNENVF